MERTVRTQPSLPKQEEMEENGESEKYEEKSPVLGGGELINGKSVDEESSPNSNISNNNNVLHRSRSQSKVKLLVRSHAVREETSPPPEADCCSPPGSPVSSGAPAQPGGGLRIRHKLRREGSSQGGSTESYEPTLSRGNSREQYDGGNGVDLQQFIVETLNRNHKDRMLLLKIEYELLNLAKDSKRTAHKFGQMSSYQRMLVHRVAAYFGMEHNVDPTGASVIVNTTKATRIPDRRFRDFVREDLLLPEEPRRSILKRDSSSFDETGCFKSGDRMLNGESRRSKSFEEREEEYQIARRRIFNREHSGEGEVECMEELHWEADGVCPQCEQTGRLQSHSNSIESGGRNVRLLKVESYESGETLRANSLRLSVSKSHSFNGYDPPHNTRILTKQDSGSSMSSRISPSSSGYKSQRSDATLSATPSPTATPNLHTQLSGQSGGLSPDVDGSGGAVVWAVTDLASVPPGSMLIHPQTGQPYTNPDGSIYHFDPGNPPRMGGGVEVIGETVAKEEPQGVLESEVSSRSSSQDKQMATVVTHYDHPIPHTNPHHIHDPRINNRGGGSVLNTGGYSGGYPASYPGHQYNLLLPPQSGVEPAPLPPQYHPISVCPTYLPHQYDPRIHESSPAGDLATYMMGLSVDNTRTLPDTRSAVYWPSHHIQTQGSGGNPGGGGGIYYSGAGGGTAGARYPPPFAGQPTPHLVHHPPPPQPQPQDHSGGCYGGGYGGAPGECIAYAGSTSALHMYYPTPSNNSGQGGGSSQTGSAPQGGGYYSAGVAASPIVTLQYQQPCPHPTPPHTPQGVCSQFAVYNSCYPGHYAPPNSAIPVAQLFRKPALQVGVRCGSEVRGGGGYTGPGSLKEREEKQPPPHLQHSLPVYGIRVIPGDMRLLGSTGRLPFSLPTPKSTHNRKHRCKSVVSGSGGGSRGAGSGPLLAQQTALSSPLQLSTLHAPPGKA